MTTSATPASEAATEICQLCTKPVESDFDGHCTSCDRTMCRSCNKQGNECTDCTSEAQQSHQAALAQSDWWSTLTDDERGEQISLAMRLA